MSFMYYPLVLTANPSQWGRLNPNVIIRVYFLAKVNWNIQIQMEKEKTCQCHGLACVADTLSFGVHMRYIGLSLTCIVCSFPAFST